MKMSTIRICRMCGENIYNFNARNLFSRENYEILCNIQILTGISLIDEEHLPNHICSRCNSDLNHSMSFRERCIKTQKLLLDEKPEKSSSFDQLNDEEPMTSLQCEQQCENALSYHIKRVPTIKQITKGDVVRNRLPRQQLPTLRYETSVEDCNIKTRIKSQKSETKVFKSVRNESLKCEVVRTRRRVPTDKTFVCDKCGRCFTDSSNLKVHLLRHSGVKDFECKECDAKYFTQHLLNLHIRVRHQGETPYVCKYCGERFFTSTSRCRHERVKHIRKMSFSCKLCGKKYYTKSCLNKHKFLHTGERPYRCDVCDIGFPRNTNLKIHYRSQQHQKKAATALKNKLDIVGEINYVEDEINFANSIIEEIYV